ncbi:hypothetical protein ACTID9_07520 [Brevibacillus fluminis]|uniref:hypothetical protein n=1 Tax=Brevibacillus fluminis TaxID=511487 RepID=UPI003F8C1749
MKMFWVVWAVVGVVVWIVMNTWLTGQKDMWWASLIATLVGTWLGDFLLGDWAWMLAGFNVIAGIIGGVVFNWLWGLLRKQSS